MTATTPTLPAAAPLDLEPVRAPYEKLLRRLNAAEAAVHDHLTTIGSLTVDLDRHLLTFWNRERMMVRWAEDEAVYQALYGNDMLGAGVVSKRINLERRVHLVTASVLPAGEVQP